MCNVYILVPGRPKHLLVLVNPLSGNFKGQEIYETVVAPVFKLAGIRTEVIGKLFLKRTILQIPHEYLFKRALTSLPPTSDFSAFLQF